MGPAALLLIGKEGSPYHVRTCWGVWEPACHRPKSHRAVFQKRPQACVFRSLASTCWSPTAGSSPEEPGEASLAGGRGRLFCSLDVCGSSREDRLFETFVRLLSDQRPVAFLVFFEAFPPSWSSMYLSRKRLSSVPSREPAGSCCQRGNDDGVLSKYLASLPSARYHRRVFIGLFLLVFTFVSLNIRLSPLLDSPALSDDF